MEHEDHHLIAVLYIALICVRLDTYSGSRKLSAWNSWEIMFVSIRPGHKLTALLRRRESFCINDDAINADDRNHHR